MELNPKLAEIIEEYRKKLADILGDDLESVVVYGSQARGEAIEASDIDVLCIMRRSFDYSDLIRRTSEATAAISLQHDVVLSRAFVMRIDYEKRSSPFLMNVRREQIAL